MENEEWVYAHRYNEHIPYSLFQYGAHFLKEWSKSLEKWHAAK